LLVVHGFFRLRDDVVCLGTDPVCTAYLWASGFKPSLLTYDGWEVPTPLRIDIEHGDADIEQVAADIFGCVNVFGMAVT
jgi:hypothetical protein